MQNIMFANIISLEFLQSRTKKRGFLEGGFARMYASLGCGALSAKCTAGPNILGILVLLGVTLDSAETPFATTPPSHGS